MATTLSAVSSTTTIGSLPGPQNTSQEIADGADSWVTMTCPRIVFLGFILGFGLLGNLFLVITLCHARQFRSLYFFICVVNLAVVNLAECLLNMSVLLTTSIQKSWSFGTIPCRLSAFFLHAVSIETILGLTILTTDRMIAVRFKEKYDHVVSNPRITIVIFYTWVQALAFSFPIAIGSIPVAANSYIYYCSISHGVSLVYSVFSTFFCFIVPLVIMVTFYIKIIRTGYKERVLVRTLISQHHYKDDGTQEPRIKQEIRHTNLAATLCVTWLLLQGPHVVTFYFTQFQGSSELEKVSSEELSYVWYVDMVLLWLRFSYVLALPIASFVWNKDLWKAFKDIILCRKNNAVVDESFRKHHTDSETHSLERKIKEEKQKEKDCLSPVREDRVFHVPVLFATARGVHIKTYDQDYTDAEEESEVGVKQDGLSMRGKKCDVIDSRENLNNIGDDTSDYDSGNEMDPFSVSHPISAKILGPVNNLNNRRSSSQPEVRCNNTMPNGKNPEPQTFDSPSNGDSGLDLSISHNSSIRRKGRGIATVDSTDTGNNNQNVEQSSNESKQIVFETVNKDIIVTNTQDINENENAENNLLTTNTDKIGNTKIKSSTTGNKMTETQSQRQKKKKQRTRTDDCNSSVPSSPLPPLRPPPRLAPIKKTDSVSSEAIAELQMTQECTESVHGDTGGDETVQTNVRFNDAVTSGDSGHANICFTGEIERDRADIRHSPGQSIRNGNEFTSSELRLDCSRDDDCVQDEVLSPSACKVSERSLRNAGNQSPNNETRTGYQVLACDHDADCSGAEAETINGETRTRNCEARRKRRERMLASPNSLLLDNKGYTRLMPDTP